MKKIGMEIVDVRLKRVGPFAGSQRVGFTGGWTRAQERRGGAALAGLLAAEKIRAEADREREIIIAGPTVTPSASRAKAMPGRPPSTRAAFNEIPSSTPSTAASTPTGRASRTRAT